MRYLILFLSINLFSKTCPENISSQLKTCTPYTCLKDDTKKLQSILNFNDQIVTEVEIKRSKKACYLKFKSNHTGVRVCKFPKKYLSQMAKIYGKIESVEGIQLFEKLKKLSEANSKEDFQKRSIEIQVLENEMLQKQVKLQKIFSESPKIKKYWKKFCRTNVKKVKKENKLKFEKLMGQLNTKITQLEAKISKKVETFKK